MPEAVEHEMSLPVIVYPAKARYSGGNGFHAMFPGNRFKISGFGKTEKEAVKSLQKRLAEVIHKGYLI